MSTVDNQSVPDIARIIVDLARSRGYIGESLAVSPELVETEKQFLSRITIAVRERVEMKKENVLDQEELISLFIYTYAKACENALQWHENGAIPEPSVEGMFSGNVPCQLKPELFEYFNAQNLPGEFSKAFLDWTVDQPDYCKQQRVHPILPLLEALKWTYRISLGMMFDYLES